MAVRADRGSWLLALAATLTLACGSTTHSNGAPTGGTGGANVAGASGDGGRAGCERSREGDLVVRTPAELEALRGHHLVTGDLIIDCPDCTTLEPLSCLDEVGLMLSIVGCDQLESLDGLSAFRRAGLRGDNGGVAIGFHFVPWPTAGNARLRTLAGLGPLERIEGRIDVRKNPQLRDLVALAGLERIEGSLYLDDNDSLSSLQDLSALWSLRSAIEISDNDALVDLSGLGSLGQAYALGISENDSLETLAGLDRFWGYSADLSVSIMNNPRLRDVSALGHLSGTIRDIGFRGNAALRSVALNPELKILSSSLNVSENAVLESFVAPGLTHLGQGIQIEKNPLLTTLDLGAPASVGSLTILDNHSLRDTAALAAIRLVTGSVYIDNNPELERLLLPELQEVSERLEIRANPALTALELGSLRSAESIDVSWNALLPSCLVTELLASAVTTSFSSQCDNAPDECLNECPPRP